MTRFNYLARQARPAFGTIGLTFAVDNRVRGPLAALLGIMLVTSVLITLQWTRWQAAQREYAEAALRVGSAQRALDDSEALRARLAGEARLSRQIAELRRASLLRANELARIGNELPPDVWLGSLRLESGTYSLEGRSARPAAVALALTALRDPANTSIPQLVSLRDDVDAAGSARFRYTIRLQAQR